MCLSGDVRKVLLSYRWHPSAVWIYVILSSYRSLLARKKLDWARNDLDNFEMNIEERLYKDMEMTDLAKDLVLWYDMIRYIC
jgi:hypothetical protein